MPFYKVLPPCRGIRPLYMSGYSDATISERGILVEGAQLLEKPFTPEYLARAVRRALDAEPRHFLPQP